MRFRRLARAASFAAVLLGSPVVVADPVLGTCTSCSSAGNNPACGQCVGNGNACFDTLPAAERRDTVFQTSDGGDARRLRFAHLIRGVSSSASDFQRAVNRGYGGSGWGFYGAGAPSGYCSPPGGPAHVFATDAEYHFGWNHTYEDTFNALDCYNGEIDRFYAGVPGHTDGDRVCDGEQARFLPQDGAVFDLGGDGNRVAVFPYTDHPPLPCESFEYSVWLSDDPDATQIADAGHPDGTKWNPAVLTRAFLQGWIPDAPSSGGLNPDLNNATQRDGIVQVFSLPCGLTFRYASLVAGNNGNPGPACTFWSFDAELDAVAGLNEDDTANCPDADGDGFRDAACGGNDCNDRDPAVNPGAIETCATMRDVNCDGVVTGCPSNTTCVNGLCAPQCVEGACPTGQTCVDGDGGVTFCVPTPCAHVVCPTGQVCGAMGCQDPCAGAHCPFGQVCRGGSCVDPCAGVLCPGQQHCEAGACVPNCSCAPCTGDAVCSSMSGRCGAMGCDALACSVGSSRDCTGALPRCVSACAGVTCPLGARCDGASGRCVADLCANVTCPSDSTCNAGQCVRVPRMDAGVLDAGIADARVADARTDAPPPDVRRSTADAGALDSGLYVDASDPACACRTVGGSPRGARWIPALGLALLGLRRRRRRG